jgi:signal peptidase I
MLPMTWGILICLGVVAGGFLIRAHLLIVTVEHESMLPTLQHGDRVLALRRGFHRWIRQGSIVVVALPGSEALPEPADLYIKRAVAVGEVTITLPAPSHGLPADTVGKPTADEQTWHVPHRHLFVCGDNRASSLDSRQWGPIPLSHIRGLVLIKLWSAPAHPALDQTARHVIPPTRFQPGDLAPDFSCVSQQGQAITLRDYRGQAVLLVFTTSGPLMRQHLPSYLSFAGRLEALGVRILLACDASASQTRDLIETLGIRFPVVAAPHSQHPLLAMYGISLLPAYCLIGADGRVLTSGLASMGVSSWQQDILSQLDHPRSAAV